MKHQRFNAAGIIQVVANWQGDPSVILYCNRRPQPLSIEQAKVLAEKLKLAIEAAERGEQHGT